MIIYFLPEDDYASSDLHLRSRSQSPSQLALNVLGNGKRQRQVKIKYQFDYFWSVLCASDQILTFLKDCSSFAIF